jgi:2-C-methyl-D-erythritol 4-phosphate cytidylyltransferase
MTSAIILAAGKGQRMGTELPKQFLSMGDDMLLTKTIRVFEESSVIQDIVLVTSEDWIGFCKTEIVDREGFRKVRKIVAGGKERYDSVYQGLLACPNADYVFIHDGARPFVTEEILVRTQEAVEKYEACAVGVPSKDTVKIVDEDGFVESTPPRKNVWNIQTPQAFSYPLIRAAYEVVRDNNMTGITDDAMIIEKSRLAKVKLVMGSYYNIKITTPEDMKWLI